MLNIEKYKDEILDNYRHMQFYEAVKTVAENHGVCLICNINIAMSWLCEEYKEPVLTEYEKNWLKVVCEPFHNKVEFVTKEHILSHPGEFISIEICADESIIFPFFEEGSQFKNMKVSKEYTLEELGVFYDK